MTEPLPKQNNAMIRLNTGTIKDLHFLPITVEISVRNGFPDYRVTGLAGKQIKESEDRIRNAFISSGFIFPRKKIFINLKPSDIDKNDNGLDLAIATGILLETNQLELPQLSEFLFLGGLDFRGQIETDSKKLAAFLLDSYKNKSQWVFIGNIDKKDYLYNFSHNISSLRDLKSLSIDPHQGGNLPKRISLPRSPLLFRPPLLSTSELELMLLSILSREPTLLIGPPGGGKTLIADMIAGFQRFIGIEDYLTQKILGQSLPAISAPLQETTLKSFIGRDSNAFGLATRTTGGNLILNELPEFSREVLYNLKTLLDQKQITYNQKDREVTLPANFHLIATTNPCKCGYAGSLKSDCICKEYQIQSYFRNISGGLLDRLTLTAYISDDVPREIVPLDNIYKRIDDYYKTAKPMTDKIESSKAIQMLKESYNFSQRKLKKIQKIAKILAQLEAYDTIKDSHYYRAAHHCDNLIFRRLLNK